jgi:hypothetical protein
MEVRKKEYKEKRKALLTKYSFLRIAKCTKREGRCFYYSINYEWLKKLHTCAAQLLKAN